MTLTPEALLSAYAAGYFPMADSRDGKELRWFHPERRGVIPLDNFHIPSSLKKFLRKCPWRVTLDQTFGEVIRACAQREETWINDEIIALYGELHARGFAHSVEVWEDDRLIGGLYGVALGSAFFGESMFSRAPNASKTALVHLAEHLRAAGYTLLDAQFTNEHLKQFGLIEIPREAYMARLEAALKTLLPEGGA